MLLFDLGPRAVCIGRWECLESGGVHVVVTKLCGAACAPRVSFRVVRSWGGYGRGITVWRGERMGWNR